MSKKHQEEESLVPEVTEAGFVPEVTEAGVRTFNIEDMDNIAIGRGGSGNFYGKAREVLTAMMQSVESGQGILVRDIVARVREEIVAAGEEDPNYQPICTRVRNFATSSKLYMLKTNANRVSFVIKK